ncbi:MAG: GxxExxY protein [Candidatus Saccharimonadaceae bacterium]
MKYEELTHKIIGCAIEVHSHLGNGFTDIIYQQALSFEMNMNNIHFERDKKMLLQYKGHEVGTHLVDFFVEEKIMVDIKAILNLEDVHLAQSINNVEAYNMEVGLLLNFGSKRLQFKRVHNIKNKFEE